MLVIRLTKIGKKGEAKYRIVLKEKRDRRDGKYMENLGWFEKTVSGKKMELKKDRIQHWISKGAQPSPTVKELIAA